MNTDVGAGSFFMSVDFSKEAESNKLTFECPWDFNWSYYSNSRYIGKRYEGLSAATFCSDDFWRANASRKDRSNVWYILFMRAEWFRDMVRERWTELDEAGVFDKSLEAIDFWMENYVVEFEDNREKWGNDWLAKAQKTRTWLENRYEWLENEFFTMDN